MTKSKHTKKWLNKKSNYNATFSCFRSMAWKIDDKYNMWKFKWTRDGRKEKKSPDSLLQCNIYLHLILFFTSLRNYFLFTLQNVIVVALAAEHFIDIVKRYRETKKNDISNNTQRSILWRINISIAFHK